MQARLSETVSCISEREAESCPHFELGSPGTEACMFHVETKSRDQTESPDKVELERPATSAIARRRSTEKHTLPHSKRKREQQRAQDPRAKAQSDDGKREHSSSRGKSCAQRHADCIKGLKRS